MLRSASKGLAAGIVTLCLGTNGQVNATELAHTAQPNESSTSIDASGRQVRDRLPGLSIDSVRINESAGSAVHSLTLSAASAQTIEVVVHTVPATATGGRDYYGFTRTVTFSPGETRTSVSVSVINDNVIEAVESLGVRLAQARNADIVAGRATLTIVDDDNDSDQQVVAEVFDTEVSESTSTAFVEVQLQQPADALMSIGFATGSSTAQAGSDYYGIYTELTFQPGQSSARVRRHSGRQPDRGG